MFITELTTGSISLILFLSLINPYPLISTKIIATSDIRNSKAAPSLADWTTRD